MSSLHWFCQFSYNQIFQLQSAKTQRERSSLNKYSLACKSTEASQCMHIPSKFLAHHKNARLCILHFSPLPVTKIILNLPGIYAFRQWSRLVQQQYCVQCVSILARAIKLNLPFQCTWLDKVNTVEMAHRLMQSFSIQYDLQRPSYIFHFQVLDLTCRKLRRTI